MAVKRWLLCCIEMLGNGANTFTKILFSVTLYTINTFKRQKNVKNVKRNKNLRTLKRCFYISNFRFFVGRLLLQPEVGDHLKTAQILIVEVGEGKVANPSSVLREAELLPATKHAIVVCLLFHVDHVAHVSTHTQTHTHV